MLYCDRVVHVYRFFFYEARLENAERLTFPSYSELANNHLRPFILPYLTT